MKFHFFVSGVCGWGSAPNLNDAIDNFMRSVRKGLGQGDHHLPVYIWLVPGEHDETFYQINYFAPIIDGATCVGVLTYNNWKFDIRRYEEMDDDNRPYDKIPHRLEVA